MVTQQHLIQYFTVKLILGTVVTLLLQTVNYWGEFKDVILQISTTSEGNRVNQHAISYILCRTNKECSRILHLHKLEYIIQSMAQTYKYNTSAA
jgi:hypothetical protein